MAKKDKTPKRDRIVWLDKGVFQTFIGFVPSKAAWSKMMADLQMRDRYPV